MSVFGASTSAPKVLKADKAILTAGGQTVIGLSVAITFQRGVERVPVIGPQEVLSVSKPNGTIQIGTIVAKGNEALAAFHLNDDGCSPFTLTLDLKDGACDSGSKTITAYGCVSSSVSIEANGGRGYIASGVGITFTGMDM